MTRFILVHGASHGGWCWKSVAEALKSQGHEVHAPDLPGRAGDGMPLGDVTMEHYVTTITDLLEMAEEKTVLVGHSMGGFAVTGAADAMPDRVHSIIYLTAYAPIDGDTVVSILESDPSSSVPAATEVVEGGLAVQIAEQALVPLFYNDCRAEDAADAISRLVPEPAIPLATPLALSDDRSGTVPKSYIGCLDDQCISIDFQRKLADRSGSTWAGVLNSGHSPFLSQPEALAEMLTELGLR